MGTSASSNGPAGGVPMVPPWVPDPVPPNPAPMPPVPPPDTEGAGPADGSSEVDQQAPGQNQPPAQQAPPVPSPRPIPMAPTARFGAARLRLGRFAKSGDSRDMRR